MIIAGVGTTPTATLPNDKESLLKPTICAVLLAFTASAPASAQFLPFPGESTTNPGNFNPFPVKASLRCWYRNPRPTDPLATAYILAEHFELRGRWADAGLSPSSNIFYTEQSPDELQAACERTLAANAITDKPIQWTAADSSMSYNHQVWHEGKLTANGPVERMVVFGDSLSDTGNIYNDLQWKFPAPHSWFLGRFSNGPVWPEYFAEMTALPMSNWAIGGAETKNAFVFINGLDTQIRSFAKYAAKSNVYDPSRTLFTVLAGANDIMNDGSADMAATIQASERLEASLNDLVRLGARKIALLNLPDISRTPSFRDDAQQAFLIQQKVNLYNLRLFFMVERIQEESDVDIRIVDLKNMFDRVLAAPDAVGLSNTTHSCLNMPTDNKTDYVTGPAMTPACDPDRYVFWDRVHPTTRMHRMIAEAVFDTVAKQWELERH